MKDLSPLSKSEIKIGEVLKFPIFDGGGHLLLAAGQVVQSDKHLDELAAKGLYQNPKWATLVSQSRSNMGTVAPKADIKTTSKKADAEDPSESGQVLKMCVEGSEEGFLVRLIGTLGREAFLVTHPVRDHTLVFAKEGQSWEFRAFYGTSVYKFRSQIQKVILAPYPMLVLAWPHDTQTESKVIRAARRVNCDLPAALRVSGKDSAALSGAISNISTGGMEFSTWHKAKLSVADRVQVAFQIVLGDHKYVLEPAALVTSVAPDSDANHTRVGLAFSQLGPDEFSAISAFVNARLIQRLESPLYGRSA